MQKSKFLQLLQHLWHVVVAVAGVVPGAAAIADVSPVVSTTAFRNCVSSFVDYYIREV